MTRPSHLIRKIFPDIAMHTKIRLLDEQTINKIAAGEVIENPASVVKELVENSLDAGASSICVEIQEGGRELIRVTDNGCGMSGDDALLCLERHATSKIKEVQDIQELITMGFRGEAIPSIASISKFTLHTYSPESKEGSLIKMEGGRIISVDSAVRSQGTTIEVKSLFYNVPVRRKFQKSPAFDTQAILKMISLLALGYPNTQFELISDQKILLKPPLLLQTLTFNALLENRIESVLGKEFSKTLSPIGLQHDQYSIEGFIGLPAQHKPNRSGQYLFINQRAVNSPLVSSAIREGYGPMLPAQRYPIYVLHLKLPGSLVDVNVHPQKKEVRLRQEQKLKEFIFRAVQNSWQKSPLLTETSPDYPKQEIEESAPIPPFFSAKKEWPQACEDKWEYLSYENAEPSDSIVTRSMDAVPENDYLDPMFAVPESNPKALLTIKGYTILDSFNTKLHSITSNRTGGFCILSQKNAYARIYYERLVQKSVDSSAIQTLLIPLNLTFNSLEARLIKIHLAELNHLGFSMREFGEQSFMLEAFPNFLEKIDLTDCLNALVKDLANSREARKLEQIKKEQLAWIACKASTQPGKRLSIQEAQLLIDRLFACPTPFQCPLGKPTITYWSPEEMSKFFD